MLIHFFLIIFGLGLLIGGGDLLVRGASALARSVGVSSLVVGLTVVAFGTSAPELAVNVLAALRGNSDISFGNIIGSNIANIGLVLGCTSLIRPLAVEGKAINRELPMMLLASVAALVMGADAYLRSTASGYDRADGIVLLLFFGVFIYYTVYEVILQQRKDPLVQQEAHDQTTLDARSVVFNLLMIVAGFFLLIAGGKVAVDNAVLFAEGLGVSKSFIGLTIIAVGTSLPELVTSIMAALRNETDLAIGNVLGSNIFNLLFVTGVSSTVRTIEVPVGGHLDLLIMIFLSFLLVPLSLTCGNRIVRLEGTLLLLIYFGYIAYRALV